MRRQSQSFSVGEDSFLDTTANLVGILIILVVVIGTKTRLDAEEYGRQLSAATAPPPKDEDLREANALQESWFEQQTKLAEYELETQYRRLERERLLEHIAFARIAEADQLSNVDDVELQAIEQEKALHRLQFELSQVDHELAADESTERPTVILEHLPTPMAKTVFSRELHVRLQYSRVTVIPWDRLVGMLKEHVPLAARRNASRNVLDDRLGPIGGFLMHYRMVAIPGGFELERFELQTTSDAPSESLAETLSPGGRLRLELASRVPAETVVTVWVYPDSFEQFRQLKMQLFSEGFLCAARPLPADVRIGASPHGSRSSAQ